MKWFQSKKACIALLFVFLVIAGVLFFPRTTYRTLSGDGAVLSAKKEYLGDCRLSVTIREVRSPLLCYRKNFTMVLDGRAYTEYDASHFDCVEDFCAISQAYYDPEINNFDHYDLLYAKDFRYAAVIFHRKIYFLDFGSGMAYTDIPFEFISPDNAGT